MTTVLATIGKPPDRQQEINYCDVKVIGNGSFGVVYQARLLESNDSIAIKKVLQDKRFKNRELQIMRRLDHCNIIRLQFFFYSSGDKVSVGVMHTLEPPCNGHIVEWAFFLSFVERLSSSLKFGLY